MLEYDFQEMAARVQHGLDRLTASYLVGHGARARRDVVDFHGREHLDLEAEHGGHHLRVRQVAEARAIGDPRGVTPEEFESLFDGRAADQAPLETLANWLRGLPAGRAAPERVAPRTETDNPFLAEAPRRSDRPASNPLLEERSADQPRENPFAADDEAERRKRRAREWLGGG
jgi:hypothetical protein